MDKYFTNTVSRVGGITIRDIQNDLEARHKQAFDPLGLDISMELTSLGEHKLRSGKLAEDHLYNPLTIHLLQQACWTGDYNKFKAYTDAVTPRAAMPCTCAACWTSIILTPVSRWTKWKAGFHRTPLQDRCHELWRPF